VSGVCVCVCTCVMVVSEVCVCVCFLFEMHSNVLTSFQGLGLTATAHNKVSTWSYNNEEE